jgi:transposase
MSKKRRQFTPEFKAEVIALCRTGNRTAGQVARDLGICASVVQLMGSTIEGESSRRVWRPNRGGA